MRLRLRLLLLLLSSLLKKPIRLLDESVLNLRVLPNDIDVKKISNDRFLALMDLGRMDIAFRAGLLKSMIKNKWVPLATFDIIRFRYPLKAFQKYQLRTRIIWWDDRTGYFKQVFERKGRVVATGYVCATFLGANGPIAPDDILAEIGQSSIRPSEPKIVAKLRELEALIHETQSESFAK
ncbi:MAG: thioesterase family protein [Candidatus Thiodiazotropha sp. (ex Codakia orbicularis)]|nr:thioesterase family protein [Candidatus Thiodiazotropha sp. (ex Codakia orbicularis)]MCG7863466.1 thioesterase family protein [Candidatus Thiodiazotropha endolucinida]